MSERLRAGGISAPPERPKTPRAIIGVGNVLLGDEGVGVHAAHALKHRPLPPDIEVLDGGTEGLGLMDAICGLDRLVVIDCVRGGEAPGTIYRFDWGDRQSEPARRLKTSTSVHQTSLADVLDRVALVCELPRTTIIGVEPRCLEMSLELSEPVAARLETVCALALEQCQGP
jgi:hydrogenase maturation protease